MKAACIEVRRAKSRRFGGDKIFPVNSDKPSPLLPYSFVLREIMHTYSRHTCFAGTICFIGATSCTVSGSRSRSFLLRHDTRVFCAICDVTALFWPSAKWRHFPGAKFELCGSKNIPCKGFCSVKLTYLDSGSHKLSYLEEKILVHRHFKQNAKFLPLNFYVVQMLNTQLKFRCEVAPFFGGHE